MEVFLLVIILGLITAMMISAGSYRSTMKQKINHLDKKVNYLVKEFRNLKQEEVVVVKEKSLTENKPIQKEEINQPKPLQEQKEEPIKPIEKPIEEKTLPINSQEDKLDKELNDLEKKQEAIEKPIEKKVAIQQASITEKQENKKPVLEQKPKEKQTFEQQVGENWLNKIGIIILVLGIGYSVKYAIDNNWINESGRVLIGLGAGAVLLGIAYYLRKSYRAFSSVLAGGAFATFYYTITIAYQYYQMFNQPTAFGIMVGITLFSSFLAIKFDRLELAAISLVGGFTSPFMVAGETNNYVSFFTYLSILNVGMLLMSYFKKWPLIKMLSILFTVLLFSGFVVVKIIFDQNYKFDENILPVSFAFASIYYVIFYSAIVLYNIRKEEKFDGWQLASLITISLVYLSCGLVILQYIEDGKYQGIFTISLAAVNLLVGFIIKSIKTIDVNLYHVSIGKVITLATLFAPIQFDGYTITSFWVVESAVLIWLAQKTKIGLFRHLSFSVFALSTVSLVINWSIHYGVLNTSTPFVNVGFMTFIISALAFVGGIYLLRNDEKQNTYLIANTKSYQTILKVWLGFISYIFFLLEFNDMADFYGSFKSASWIKVQLNFGYHILVALILIYWNKKSKSELIKTFILIGIAMLAMLYLTLGNLNTIYLRNATLTGTLGGIWFNLHYLASALLMMSFFFYHRFYIKPNSKEKGFANFFFVTASIFALWVLSVELDHVAVKLYASNTVSIPALNLEIDKITSITHKAGYTVLWGIFSFAMMFFGMKKNLQVMRLIALILFLITIVKLLVFDLYNISELGRIIAFIALGIILLIVSFMYQRLKKLIVEGE